MRSQFMDDLFPEVAKMNRDLGIGTVTNNNIPFMAQAIAVVSGMSGELTGEEIRIHLTSIGITPSHHNAWGAVIMHCRRKGILVRTGKYVQMKDPQSHARENPVYRVSK